MPTPRQHASNAQRQRAYRQRQEQARLAALEAKNLPPVSAVPTLPSRERWKALHGQARAALQTMLDEMQSYYDDRTEKWRESEKGEAFGEIIDQVDAARASVEEIALG